MDDPRLIHQAIAAVTDRECAVPRHEDGEVS
jgi:hypothetical protein